jgi:hypothetical protein
VNSEVLSANYVVLMLYGTDFAAHDEARFCYSIPWQSCTASACANHSCPTRLRTGSVRASGSCTRLGDTTPPAVDTAGVSPPSKREATGAGAENGDPRQSTAHRTTARKHRAPWSSRGGRSRSWRRRAVRRPLWMRHKRAGRSVHRSPVRHETAGRRQHAKSNRTHSIDSARKPQLALTRS